MPIGTGESMSTGRSHPARRRARVAGLLLLLPLGGCALPELAWQQLDDVLVARADEWLDLTPDQEQALRGRLEPWLAGLRRERLPGYARFLDGLAVRVRPDIDLDDARWASDRVDRLYADGVESFLPVITPTLADLSPAQRAHLADRMAEANEAYRADFIDGRDDGMYALAERIIAAVERWTGTLDANQRALVHRRARELPRTSAQWLRFRERMQEQLLARIESGAGPAEIERTLQRWWIGPLNGEAAVAAETAALRDGLLRTLVALGRTLTAEQRAEARRRLRARSDTLWALAESAG